MAFPVCRTGLGVRLDRPMTMANADSDQWGISSMATHRLDVATDTVHWGFFDAALKPLLTVDSGDTVTISTVSGMASQMPAAPLAVPPALAAIHKSVQQKLPGHICTGPVAVKG